MTEGRDSISFGPFRLFPAARAFEKNGVPLALGNRALDILMAMPGFLLAIAVIAALGPSTFNLVVAVAAVEEVADPLKARLCDRGLCSPGHRD